MGDVRQAPPDIRHDVDDVSLLAALPPVAGGLLHHVPGAVEIGVDHGLPALDRKVDRLLRKLPARVVDQHIQPALFLPHLPHQGFHLFRVADGHGLGHHGRPQLGEALFGDGQLFRIAPANHHGCAQPREEIGDALADAAPRAGNQHHLSRKEILPVYRGQCRQFIVVEAEFSVVVAHARVSSEMGARDSGIPGCWGLPLE